MKWITIQNIIDQKFLYIIFAGSYFLFWKFSLPLYFLQDTVQFIIAYPLHLVHLDPAFWLAFFILFRSLSPEKLGEDWDIAKSIVLQVSFSVYNRFSKKLIKDELVLNVDWRILVSFAILVEASGLLFLLLFFWELLKAFEKVWNTGFFLKEMWSSPKPLGESKVDSVFHPSEVDHMRTSNPWVLTMFGIVLPSTVKLR